MAFRAFQTEALALASPSGRMSKRARNAVLARIRENLFTGIDLTGGPTPEPTEAQRLRAHAARLLDLAERGMSARKYRRLADEAISQAEALEG